MSTAFVTINEAVVEQENAIGDDVTQVWTTAVRDESQHSPLMDLTGASVLDTDWYGGLATVYENDGGSNDKEGDCGRMDDGVDDVDPPELVMIKGPVDVKPCDPGNILGEPVDDDNIEEVYSDFAGDVDKSGAVMIGTAGMEHGCDHQDAASEPSDHEFASGGMEALMDKVNWRESIMIEMVVTDEGCGDINVTNEPCDDDDNILEVYSDFTQLDRDGPGKVDVRVEVTRLCQPSAGGYHIVGLMLVLSNLCLLCVSDFLCCFFVRFLSVSATKFAVKELAMSAVTLPNTVTSPQSSGNLSAQSAIPKMHFTYFKKWHPVTKTVDEQLDANELVRIADALNIPLHYGRTIQKRTMGVGPDGAGNDTMFVSRRSKQPLNEFELGDHCLMRAFPDIFLFGEAYGRVSSCLSKREWHHLLLQFDAQASLNKDLLTFVFDQHQWHSNIWGINQYLKGNPNGLKKFTKLWKLPDFDDCIQRAIHDTKSADAKWIHKVTTPLLATAQKKLQWGALEQSQTITKMKALSQWYGPGSIFFTIAPIDVNNPTCVWLTLYAGNNKEFPAVDDNCVFSELDMEEQKANADLLGEGMVQLPYSYANRMCRIIKNPIASVLEYRMLIGSLISIMFGITPNFHGNHHHTNRTMFYGKRWKGVFGMTHVVIGVTETQKHGALHFHCIVMGSVPPDVLQKVSHIEELCKAMACALDKMFGTSVPKEVHMRYVIEHDMKCTEEWRLQLQAQVPSMFTSLPSPWKDPVGFAKHVCHIVREKQIHTHSFTCHKGKTGEWGC